MDPLEASDISMTDALSVMADWQESARVVRHEMGLCVLGKSRFPTPYSNAMFPSAASHDPSEVIANMAGVFADRRYFLWSRGRDGGGLGSAALSHGFMSLGELPVMVVDKPLPPGESPGVTVEVLTSAHRFADFVTVSLLSYAEAGLPEPVLATLLARPAKVVATSVVAIGRIDGTAVSAALSITDPGTGVGGVYWVGTSPSARRRGAADAVTRAVTNAAFERGARIVSLQASEAGAFVYSKMGYREVGRYARFLSPKV
jgi:hypothetical protein